MALPARSVGAISASKTVGMTSSGSSTYTTSSAAAVAIEHDLEALGPRLLGVLVLAIADAHLRAGVAQVERGGAAEMTVAEHRDGFARERAGRRVGGTIYSDLRCVRSAHVRILTQIAAVRPVFRAPGPGGS